MKNFLQSYMLLLLASAACYSAQAVVRRVDIDANGTNNGTSWANAFEDLQTALAAANSGDEIWVAEGIYKPTSTTNRNIAFEIPDGVDLYGGFNGTETQRNQRNWNMNTTVLSGAIGSLSDETDNSYDIVKIEDAPNGVLVDGFHIRKSHGPGAGAHSALYVDNSVADFRH